VALPLNDLSSRGRPSAPVTGRARKYRGWVVGIVAAILITFVSLGIGGLLARCDDAYDVAFVQLNSCSAATDRLGQPIEQSVLGCAAGSSETRGGGFGNAQWAVPVHGPAGTGTYNYAAEMHGGSWQLVSAFLEVDGQKLAVFPCGTSWEGIALEAARDAKPLLQAFGRTGVVSAAAGRTSIVPGQNCDVSVTPNAEFRKASPFNCRVVVRCGPTVLYGWEGAGYTTCLTDRGLPTTATDPFGTAEDTDPIVELDIPSRRVVVRDNNPESTWSVEVGWQEPWGSADRGY